MSKMTVQRRKEDEPVKDLEQILRENQGEQPKRERRRVGEGEQGAGGRPLPMPRPVRSGLRHAQPPSVRPPVAQPPRPQITQPTTARRLANAAIEAQRIWFENVTRPALGLLLLPLTIQGCGPAPETTTGMQRSVSAAPTTTAPAPPGQREAPPPQRQYEARWWWPAYVVRNGQLTDVSLGYPEEFWPFPPEVQRYESPDLIPQRVREDGRRTVADALAFSSFALGDSAYQAVAADTIMFPVQGPGGSISWGVGGFRIVDMAGQQGVACYEGCPEYGHTITFRMGGAGDWQTGRVILHEMLHHEYNSLSTSSQEAFQRHTRLFLNAAGSDWRMDQTLNAIWYGAYSTGPGENDTKWVEGVNPNDISGGTFRPLSYADDELNTWAAARLGTMDSQTRERVTAAIKAFLRIQTYIMGGAGYAPSEADRDGYVIGEGFPRFGANYGAIGDLQGGRPVTSFSNMPAFMAPEYREIMRGNVIDATVNHGEGYFDSPERFTNELVPLLRDFVGWMGQRHPEIGRIGQGSQ
ncbi:MAG: hypothetical protein V1861_04600 [Candidatus Micrarchaeota archaeon]